MSHKQSKYALTAFVYPVLTFILFIVPVLVSALLLKQFATHTSTSTLFKMALVTVPILICTYNILRIYYQ